jgi:hypothetical protein
MHRMHLQQEQPGHGEDQCREGEYVDEQAPRRAGIAALVKVVEIGNPAAIGDLVSGRARLQV